jgi:hypothetical protein
MEPAALLACINPPLLPLLYASSEVAEEREANSSSESD